MLKELLKGKKIASVDFGFKRLGIAICDELHISVTPYTVLDYSMNSFWEDFSKILKKERISALVVGVPLRDDNLQTDVLKEINKFITTCKAMFDLPVFSIDESFSTVEAQKLMLTLGKKKKERRKKETKDLITAALILKEFIEMHNL
ncbi:MAG: Holliday junction resolvase RuvX [Candidatus Kapaibacteriota bacterium]